MPATRRIGVITLVLGAFALGGCSSDSYNGPEKPSNGESSRTSPAHSAGSSSTTASSSSSSSQSATPSVSAGAAKASLTKAARTSVVSVVPVGSGYEGASADASTMHFWRTDASGAWVKDGDTPRTPSFSSAVKESIDGKRIRGAQHATFILQADLGGTGSSPTAQAFGRAADGWGGIASTTDDGSSIALKHSAEWNGTWHSARFTGDLLTLGSFVPGLANADGHDVDRSWAMKGNGFTLISSDDPSTKAQHFTAAEGGRFASPSGKNRCDISSGLVTCELGPTASAANEGSKLITLNTFGWALVTWADSLTGDGNDTWAMTGGGATPGAIDGTRILSYGSTIRSGDVICKSSTNGFDCSNSTAGFTVNSQGVTTHGKHNDNLAASD